MNNAKSAIAEIKSDLIKFAQDLVRIKSYSGNEKKIIERIKDKMNDLDYDDVVI